MAAKNLRCGSAPTFYQGDSSSGVVLGNCPPSEAGGSNISVYTCMDGFYTITETDIWGGYTYSNPICVHCPHHSEDIHADSSKPSYATTGGNGIHYDRYSCKIKAGSKIITETGTFEVVSECPYSY